MTFFSKVRKDESVRNTVLYFALLLATAIAVYSSYLFGDKTYVSITDAMDTYDQFYPNLVALSKGVREYLFSPYLDYRYGLGAERQWIPFNLDVWLAAFPVEYIVYLMGVFQVFKIVFSGLFFYLYLRKIGIQNYVSYICGFYYAFNGIIIMRGMWMSYATEVLLFAFWLYAYEKWNIDRSIRLLPVATFFFAASFLDLYKFILHVGMMLAYIVFRNIWDGRWAKRYIYIILLLIVITFLALGVFRLSNLLGELMGSQRFDQAGIENGVTVGTFWLSIKQLAVLFLRSIGGTTPSLQETSVLGYMGDPALYCGAGTMLLLIPCFLQFSKRQKRVSIFVLLCIAGYIFVNPLRNIANGFAGVHFKLSSLWIICILLFFVANGMDLACKDWKRTSRIVCAEAATCVLLLRGIFERIQCDGANFIISIVIFAAFILLFGFGKNMHSKLMQNGLIMLAVFEVALNSYYCVNSVDTMSTEEFKEIALYNDDTKPVLEEIYREEERRDFRVDKQYQSFRFNDAWAQDYYGSSFYIGGFGGGKLTTDFYEQLNVATSEDRYKYYYTVGINNWLDTFLGTKYILGRGKPANYGYVPETGHGSVVAFKNEYAIPIGVCFDEQISKREFEELGAYDKSRMLLQRAVVDDMPDEKKADEKALFDIGEWETYERTYATEGEFYDFDFVTDDRKNMLLLEVTYHQNESNLRNRLELVAEDDSVITYYVRGDSDEKYYYEINRDFAKLHFENYEGETIEPASLRAFEIPADAFYGEYRDIVEKRGRSALTVDTFSGREITGQMEVDAAEGKDSICCITVPANNWHVYVDGQKVDTFVVDYMFLGFRVENGKHTIEAYYTNDPIMKDIIIQWIGFAVCIFFLFGGENWLRRWKKGRR